MSGQEPQSGAAALAKAEASFGALADSQAPPADTRLPPPDVLHSPLAREMGKLLRRLVGSEDPYNLSLIHGRYYADSEYRQWVRRRLREENFMARLGAGIELLPDIREKLPVLQAWIETQNRPRTMKQMLAHMTSNLEWYLDCSKRPSYPAKLVRQCLNFALALTITVTSMGVASMAPKEAVDLFFVAIMAISWLAFSAGAIWGILSFLQLLAGLTTNGISCGERPASLKYTINAAELYLYLIELYEERPLVPLAAGDLSAEEQARDAAREGTVPAELAAGPGETVLGEMRRRIESRS